MEKLVIKGGSKLSGEITISGAKNAAVAIIPAAILVEGKCIIENIPNISDVSVLTGIMSHLGAKIEFINKNTLEIDCTNIHNYCATHTMLQKIRASYYLMGALLGRFNKARVALPGGCDFGTRPIDQHMKGFRMLGAVDSIENGYIDLNASQLVGGQMFLDMVTVGATINIMLAAVRAQGITVIENAAKEPHVVDTANFLNSMGANIKGAGTDVIKICGVEKLTGGTYSIIPDNVEAGTYMIIAAATGGDVTINNVIPKHLEAISAKLTEVGATIIEEDQSIRVTRFGPLRSASVKTLPYPGFPTDLQPLIVSLLSVANGTSYVNESVWDNRFQYVDELVRLGASIKVDGRMAVIEGVEKLTGCSIKATDLRAGAGMILATLVARGTSEITDLYHIDRGYDDFENKLRSIGASIKREYLPDTPDLRKAL